MSLFWSMDPPFRGAADRRLANLPIVVAIAVMNQIIQRTKYSMTFAYFVSVEFLKAKSTTTSFIQIEFELTAISAQVLLHFISDSFLWIKILSVYCECRLMRICNPYKHV